MKQNLNSIFQNKILYLISVAVILGIYLILTLDGIRNLDYIAINGTFQNFNVIRRLFDGQAPFYDFTVYLGFGHLYLTSFFTLLFGGNYYASVVAYDYLSSLFMIISCYTLGKIYFPKNWAVPFSLSLIFRFVNVIYFPFFNVDFSDVMEGGNSARTIRALILPVAVLLYLIVSEKIHRISNWDETKKLYANVGLISSISGTAFVYGNDYGIMVWFCSWIMLIFVLMIRFRKLKKCVISLLIMLAGNLMIISFWVEILTKGHFLSYFIKNFASVDYQSWYYNAPQCRAFYIYQLDLLSSETIICLTMFFIYCLLLIKHKAAYDKIKSYGMGAFITLTCLGAACHYKLFSGGGYKLHSVLICMLVLLTCYSLCKGAETKLYKWCGLKWNRFEHIILSGISVSTIAAITVSIISMPNKNGVYVEELGGYLEDCSQSLQTGRDIIKDGKIFSVYASSLETVSNQFQPSGTDYIIHCLSDDSRQHYLQTFKDGNFDYVSTINKNYMGYGYWIQNANWFFYREVYENYHKIGKNDYADFWAYGAEENSVYTGKITAQINQYSDNEYELVISAPKEINGIADVYIDYEADKINGMSSFMMHNYVVGVNPFPGPGTVLDSWSLSPKSQEYIPITIKNGEGKAKITSYPVDATSLTVYSVNCERIFL